jgi:large subunit ribosomal protein L13
MKLKRAKTYSPKLSELASSWHVFDAAEKPLGRLATDIARILQGKHKPTYSPHLLTGDFVIVVNASNTVTTGQKIEQKVYYQHSGYHGGLKTTPIKVMLTKNPERVIRSAVKGMLPKNLLAKKMLKRLKVYGGPDHPHEAQIKKLPKQETIEPKNGTDPEE